MTVEAVGDMPSSGGGDCLLAYAVFKKVQLLLGELYVIIVLHSFSQAPLSSTIFSFCQL